MRRAYLNYIPSNRSVLREMNNVGCVLEPECGSSLRTLSHFNFYESRSTLGRIPLISGQHFQVKQLPRFHGQTRCSCNDASVGVDPELVVQGLVHETEHYLGVGALVLVFSCYSHQVVAGLGVGRHLGTERKAGEHGFVVVDVSDCDLDGNFLRPGVVAASVRCDHLEVVDTLTLVVEQPVKNKYTVLKESCVWWL